MACKEIQVKLVQEGVNDNHAEVQIYSGKTLIKTVTAEVRPIRGADNKQYPAVHLQEK